MNKQIFAVAVAACFAAVGMRVSAEPRGGSNLDRDFIAGSSDKPGWSCGLTVNSRERNVEVLGVDSTLDSTLVAAYIGYTITPWATLYALAGQFSGELDGGFSSNDDDRRFLYGATLSFDIFSHEIQDPMLMENKIRVNSSLSYLASEIEVFNQELDFQEFQASLTASIVNDVVGNKLYLPESIAIFAGPIYSSLLDDDLNDNPDENVGLSAGLEVFHTKRISYYMRVDDFAKAGYAAGLNVRF